MWEMLNDGSEFEVDDVGNILVSSILGNVSGDVVNCGCGIAKRFVKYFAS